MSQKSTSKKTEFLLGNESIAAAALSAGVRYASSYPGTPASEILPAFFGFAERYGVEVEGGWMINEKVAFEAALAASWAGTNAMVSMKQVGLNVAMDPLMSSAYTGTEAGFIIVSVDDPGPYSSQTEQDSRFAAMFAKIPVYDPASPKDAYSVVKKAVALSQQFKIPVVVRPVLRVAHSRQDVEIEIPDSEIKPTANFHKKPGVWTATPKFRLELHKKLNEKLEEIARINSLNIENQLNKVKSSDCLFITSGALCHYLCDLGIENVIKIDMPFPLSSDILKSICESFQTVWVIEETYPVIELQIPERKNVKGRLSGHIPKAGEITLQKLKEIIDPPRTVKTVSFPEKKPRLCPGCGHRPVFYAIRRSFPHGIYPSDIGCYTLGTNIGAVDTFLCMGASVSMGMALASLYKEEKPVISTIGDSTFFHSGIPPLIEAVERKAPLVLVILDNKTTAMTGGQPVPKTDIKGMVKATGVIKVEEVHAYELEKVKSKLKECWNFSAANSSPSVLICKCPCVVYGEKISHGKPHKVDTEKCTNCGICYNVFECPAIEEKNGKAWIDPILCTGCEVCVKVCPFSAIYSS